MTGDAPDATEAAQLALLRELLATIAEDNPFYAPRLRAAGLDATVPSVAAFTERMPFTTKDELAHDQQTHPPYGTNLTFPLARYNRLHQTSSTTGRPLRWLDTADDWAWMLDGWTEVLAAAGTTPDDRVFVTFSFGPFIGLWMAFDAAARMGCLAIPGGAMNSSTRLKVLMANRVTVLCATPTYAIRLGEVAQEEGVDLAKAAVRAIVVGGEPGGSVPATRARIEALWPTARVFDHHGMTEAGPVTYQCTERTDVVHVLDRQFLCEVIDPETGAPRAADAEGHGELVLTALGRVGSPILRYRTGDLVVPAGPERCPCGRTTLQFAGGIIGRADDMVVIRGVNLFPSGVDQVVRGVEGVAEYRIEIDTNPALTEMRILVEPEAACANAGELCERLERAFRATYNLRVPVTAVPAGELPRFELKSRRWIKSSTPDPAKSKP
jgi:phenylacetate-CoA ligase